MFTQSTPLDFSRKQNILPPVPKLPFVTENDSSFSHSTPFKSNNQSSFNTSSSTIGHSILSSNSTNIFSDSNKSLYKSNDDSQIKSLENTSPISIITPSTSVSFKKRKSSFDDSKSFAFISHSQETFLSNEPNIDNARLARRKRRRTSPTELAVLKSEFKKGTTPNKQRRMLIADMVDMTEKAVQIWFQNRRQAMRKVQNSNSKEFIVELDDPKKNLENKEIDADFGIEEDSLNESDINSSSNNSDGDAELVVTIDKENNISKSQEILTDINNNNTTTISTDNTNSSYTDSSNKENIDPLTNSPTKNSSLPPRGTFSSPLSSKKCNKKTLVLTDVTNQSNNQQIQNTTAGQTFKFKSTNFGLISHTSSVSRRQKPTMKLKLKSGFPNSNKSNDFKHQGIVILNDSPNINNSNTNK